MKTKKYRSLILVALVFYVLSVMQDAFIEPIAFVFNVPAHNVWQYLAAVYSYAITLLVARFVAQELIHRYLATILKTKIPDLIGTLAAGIVVTIGICVILSTVFGKNISALVATIAGSAALLGFALQGFILALFTGISLNLEKNFKVGDRIKVGETIGDVVQITWRHTVIYTFNREMVYIPNVTLLTTQLTNFDQEDRSCRRCVRIVIDYDVSVETAERILTSAALSAHGVKHDRPPFVVALEMTPNGVQYGVYFFIVSNREGMTADHAVIKSILESMRKAGISVAFVKRGNIDGLAPVQISNRSSDLFYLVQQVKIFQNLSVSQCELISRLLIPRRVPAGAVLVQFGEQRNSIFIVAEGVLTRTAMDQDDKIKEERFISTEFIGRRSLFACLPFSATVSAEVDSLIYEFTQSALQQVLQEDPAILRAFARNLAELGWKGSQSGADAIEPDATKIENLVHQYEGQIKANYTVA
jgi:small-conductance mechanosensitive channel